MSRKKVIFYSILQSRNNNEIQEVWNLRTENIKFPEVISWCWKYIDILSVCIIYDWFSGMRKQPCNHTYSGISHSFLNFLVHSHRENEIWEWILYLRLIVGWIESLDLQQIWLYIYWYHSENMQYFCMLYFQNQIVFLFTE